MQLVRYLTNIPLLNLKQTEVESGPLNAKGPEKAQPYQVEKSVNEESEITEDNQDGRDQARDIETDADSACSSQEESALNLCLRNSSECEQSTMYATTCIDKSLTHRLFAVHTINYMYCAGLEKTSSKDLSKVSAAGPPLPAVTEPSKPREESTESPVLALIPTSSGSVESSDTQSQIITVNTRSGAPSSESDLQSPSLINSPGFLQNINQLRDYSSMTKEQRDDLKDVVNMCCQIEDSQSRRIAAISKARQVQLSEEVCVYIRKGS